MSSAENLQGPVLQFPFRGSIDPETMEVTVPPAVYDEIVKPFDEDPEVRRRERLVAEAGVRDD